MVSRKLACGKKRGDIIRVLDAVLKDTSNHALLPTGGGVDLIGAARSNEPECLELTVRPRLVYVLRPRRLILETFPNALAESFFMLEADHLTLTSTYDDPEDDEAERQEMRARRQSRGREEVLELAPGDYVSRAVWDEGNLGYDADGEELPLPREARLVVRWLRGTIMILAKGSLWNGAPQTYDGTHDRFPSSAIRKTIQKALDSLSDAA